MMSIKDKLAEAFFAVAGSALSRARARHYEDKARDSFKLAEDLMGGSKDSGVRDGLLKETEKPQSPWLARLYYQHAQQMFEKTGRPSDDQSYLEVFGVSKKEFDLDMNETTLELEFPHLARSWIPLKPNQH